MSTSYFILVQKGLLSRGTENRVGPKGQSNNDERRESMREIMRTESLQQPLPQGSK